MPKYVPRLEGIMHDLKMPKYVPRLEGIMHNPKGSAFVIGRIFHD
jgi:hypothetical protein